MASSSAPIGSVYVEVGADLTKLETGLDQARATSKAAGTQIAGDLGKIETAARGASAAADGLSAAQSRAGQSGARLATNSERLAAQVNRAAAAAAVQQRAFDALAAANDNLAGSFGRMGGAAGLFLATQAPDVAKGAGTPPVPGAKR